MRVVLAVAWYYPEATGGSEIYVRELARRLHASGVAVTVAVPTTDSGAAGVGSVDGIPVRRFEVSGKADVRLRLDRDAPASWIRLLRDLSPDLVDLHSLTSELGLPHLVAARQSGARTVTTLHLPGLICARGTLMRFGETPCDGDLAEQPCTACRLHAQGVPTVVGHALSFVSSGVGRVVERSAVPRVLQRPFTTELAHEQRRALVGAIAAASDELVALSAWQAEMLIRNAVPSEKVRVCRQGVAALPATSAQTRRVDAGRPLRVGYVGRYDEVKGVHVLVDAVSSLAGLPIELHIWGIARTDESRAYREAIRLRAEGQASIVMHAEAESSTIYPNLDVLAVPSIWFETGPQVVLEAHAAGLPVVGSNLGGIAERVEDGVNGRLVPPGDASALAASLRALVEDPSLLARLRPRHTVRTMDDVARETVDRYRQMLAKVPA